MKCPNCGAILNTGGRKKLNIPFKLLSETLQLYRSTEQAAKELGCSVGYIYQELKRKGLKPKDVIEGKGSKIGLRAGLGQPEKNDKGLGMSRGDSRSMSRAGR